MRTPWGMSDHEEVVYKAIKHYSTSSHGGIRVPKEFHALLTEDTVEGLARNKEAFNNGDLWFSEDDCLLPLMEIKASLKDLSLDELKKDLKNAIFFVGLNQWRKRHSKSHPLYQMIHDHSEEPEIDEALGRALQKETEDKLSNSPGGIVCRIFIQKEDELIRNTRDIHLGEAKSISDLKEIFVQKKQRSEWNIIESLYDSGKLVITATKNGDLYVEMFGGEKHIHVDQYEEGRITLIRKAS